MENISAGVWLGLIICSYLLLGIGFVKTMNDGERLLTYILICIFWPLIILFGICTEVYNLINWEE